MKTAQIFVLIILKNKSLLLVFGILLCFSSCIPHLFYSPAILGQDITYQPKPMVSDSVKTNYYGSIHKGLNAAYNLTDDIKFTELNASVAHALGKFNLAYSFGRLFGKYTNSSLGVLDPDYFQYKCFGAYCFRTSMNYVNKTDNFEFRFPGLEFSYSNERGDFSEFRSYQASQAHYFTNANTKLLTAGFSYELIWHSWRKRYKQYAFKVTYAKTYDNLNYKADTLYTEVSNALNKRIYFNGYIKYKNLGFSASTNRIGFKLGLTYSIN
jgi:hypothetical protein